VYQRWLALDAFDDKMYARMRAHFYICIIYARISRAIFIGRVLPRSRIITRHLLRHNTYFNWGLRAAAYTTHQSRRFIRNSSLPARHLLSLSLCLACSFSSPFSPVAPVYDRENIEIQRYTRILDQDFRDRAKVRAKISRL